MIKDCPKREFEGTIQSTRVNRVGRQGLRSRVTLRSNPKVENARMTIGESRSIAMACAYVMHAKEDAKALDVITGNFFLFDINIHTLIESGSVHS